MSYPEALARVYLRNPDLPPDLAKRMAASNLATGEEVDKDPETDSYEEPSREFVKAFGRGRLKPVGSRRRPRVRMAHRGRSRAAAVGGRKRRGSRRVSGRSSSDEPGGESDSAEPGFCAPALLAEAQVAVADARAALAADGVPLEVGDLRHLSGAILSALDAVDVRTERGRR